MAVQPKKATDRRRTYASRGKRIEATDNGSAAGLGDPSMPLGQQFSSNGKAAGKTLGTAKRAG